jgi:hypothetical protein
MKMLFMSYHVWLATLEKKKVVEVLDSFLSFSKKYEKKTPIIRFF